MSPSCCYPSRTFYCSQFGNAGSVRASTPLPRGFGPSSFPQSIRPRHLCVPTGNVEVSAKHPMEYRGHTADGGCAARKVRRFIEAGGIEQIVAGANAGSPLNYHASVPREIAHLVDAGLSPMPALQSATAAARPDAGRRRSFRDDCGRQAPRYHRRRWQPSRRYLSTSGRRESSPPQLTLNPSTTPPTRRISSPCGGLNP